MDLEKIKKLIEMVNNSGLSEFKLEDDDMKIKLINQTKSVNISMPPSAQIGHSVLDTEPQKTPNLNHPLTPPDDTFHFITSPLVGVYKPLSASDKTPVKVGDNITIGQPVCVVEAMKLINEIEADKTGEIVEILVNEGDSVEYGQNLIKLSAN